MIFQSGAVRLIRTSHTQSYVLTEISVKEE